MRRREPRCLHPPHHSFRATAHTHTHTRHLRGGYSLCGIDRVPRGVEQWLPLSSLAGQPPPRHNAPHDTHTTMMTKRKPHRRTRVALTGTTRKTEAHLDHTAALGLEFAQAWLAREGELRVPAAGVIRHALRRYVVHLQSQEDSASAAEVAAVHRACSALRVEPEDRQAAHDRLSAAIESPHPLPSFISILLGPQAIARIDDITARAESYALAGKRRTPSHVKAGVKSAPGRFMPTYLTQP